jgi:hypothetical protein
LLPFPCWIQKPFAIPSLLLLHVIFLDVGHACCLLRRAASAARWRPHSNKIYSKHTLKLSLLKHKVFDVCEFNLTGLICFLSKKKKKIKWT